MIGQRSRSGDYDDAPSCAPAAVGLARIGRAFNFPVDRNG
jgi:hypothetical protein